MSPAPGHRGPSRFTRTRIICAIVGALLATSAGFLLLTRPLGQPIEYASYDLPFKYRPFIAVTNVVMVYLDDASHEKLHQPYSALWNRAFHTKLLNRLTAEHAEAVVFDLVFSDPGDPATDQALAQAMQDNGNVVIAGDLVFSDVGSDGGRTTRFNGPFPLFADSAMSIGLDTIPVCADLELRDYVPISGIGATTRPTPSEAWAAATIANPSLLENPPPQRFWLNYYGPATELPSVSLYQALEASNSSVPSGFFSNKVVFVGESLQTKMPAARKDEYPSPYSYLPQFKFMPGVAVHATACLNLLRGDYLRRLDWQTERIIILALGLLFGAGLPLMHPLKAVIAAVLGVALIICVDYYSFVHWYYWFPFLIPVLVQIPIALVWAVASNTIGLYSQLRALQKSLPEHLPSN